MSSPDPPWLTLLSPSSKQSCVIRLNGKKTACERDERRFGAGDSFGQKHPKSLQGSLAPTQPTTEASSDGYLYRAPWSGPYRGER